MAEDFSGLCPYPLLYSMVIARTNTQARSALPPIIPCPPFDTVRPTIRVALDHCYCGIYGAEKWPKEDRPPIDLDSFAVSIPTGFLKNQRTGPDVVVGYCPTIDVAITFGDLQQMVEPRARKPRSGKKDPRKVAESLAVRMHKLRLEDK